MLTKNIKKILDEDELFNEFSHITNTSKNKIEDIIQEPCSLPHMAVHFLAIAVLP
jgi:hypothetical protein